MKLSFEQIKSAAQGALWLEERADGIIFHRYTKAQEEDYSKLYEGKCKKIFCPAGVRLEFKTDSQSLFLKVNASVGTGCNFFMIEVMADGKRIGTLGNIEDDTKLFEENGADLPSDTFCLGEFQKGFTLDKGEKTVRIYMPWSVVVVLEELCLDDDAAFTPVKRPRELLMFGDSITQGYHTRYPSCSYASRLTDALGVEAINKGWGGDRFYPILIREREEFTPKYITVAYGTNDWRNRTKEDFEENCAEFYKRLSEQYKDSRIFAVSPIWRKDNYLETKMGQFSYAADFIEKTAASLKNVIFIRADEFMPHDDTLYADRRLHPNDRGFETYFNALYAAIKPYLDKE